jgi:hypothetical protein
MAAGATASVAADTNLAKNGGFEEGEAGKLPPEWHMEKEGGAEGTVAVCEGKAHSGRRGLEVVMSEQKGYIHPSQTVVVKPGLYKFRLWARSDAETVVTMQLYDSRLWSKAKPEKPQLGSGILSTLVKLPKDVWTSHEIEFEATEEFLASIQIGLRQAGKVVLDDIEITQCPAGLALWDTMTPLGAGPAAVATGWRKVADRGEDFHGDLCLENDNIRLLVKKGAAAVELHSRLNDDYEKVGSLSIFVPVISKHAA